MKKFLTLFALFLTAISPKTVLAHNDFGVLIFSETAGFRHESIDAGIEMIRQFGEDHHFDVEQTEDSALFTDNYLSNFKVVIFLNTTRDVLNESEQAAFERFIQNGNGFVGIHSATDTEYDWPWYKDLVGSYFINHPEIQNAKLVVNNDHISTEHLSTEWIRTDEWYNFQTPLNEEYKVLISIDETSYTGGTMGAIHPVTWYREYDGGRSWYTAMGHTAESYSEKDFQDHILGGILWASGQDEKVQEEVSDPLPVYDFKIDDINFAIIFFVIGILGGLAIISEMLYSKFKK